MARLRFPGRPGHRFNKISVKYFADDINNAKDPALAFLPQFKRGLNTFRDLIGLSDEEDGFEGFSLDDIKRVEKKLLILQEEEKALSKAVSPTTSDTETSQNITNISKAVPVFNPSPGYDKIVRRRSLKEFMKKGVVTVDKNQDSVKEHAPLFLGRKSKIKERQLLGNQNKQKKYRHDFKHGIQTDGNKLKKSDRDMAKFLLEKAKQANLLHEQDRARRLTAAKSPIPIQKKEFVLPSQSSRSSRVIKPNKRFLEDDSVHSIVKKCKSSEESILASPPVLIVASPPVTPSEKPMTNSENKKRFANGNESRENVGLLDQPLIVDGKRDRKPSLKLKLSDFGTSNIFGMSGSFSSGKFTSSLTSPLAAPKLGTSLFSQSRFQRSDKQKFGLIGSSRKPGSSILQKAKLQLNRAALNKSKAALARALKEKMKREAEEAHSKQEVGMTPAHQKSVDTGKKTKKTHCCICGGTTAVYTNTKMAVPKPTCIMCKRFFKKIVISVEHGDMLPLKSLENCTGKCKYIFGRFQCKSCRVKKCIAVGLPDSEVIQKWLDNPDSSTKDDIKEENTCKDIETIKDTSSVAPIEDSTTTTVKPIAVTSPLPIVKSPPPINIFVKSESKKSASDQELNTLTTGEIIEKPQRKKGTFKNILKAKQEKSDAFGTFTEPATPKEEPVPASVIVSPQITRRNIIRGPRIKHVCRNAAVVLGKQPACFPLKPSELRLSALPTKDKVQLWKEEEQHKAAHLYSDDDMSGDVVNKPTDSFHVKTSPVRAKVTKSLRGAGGLHLYKRRMRCRNCPGCLAEDCGECRHCLDKPKYGGRGIWKQACIHRRCSNAKLKRSATEAFINETKSIQFNINERSKRDKAPDSYMAPSKGTISDGHSESSSVTELGSGVPRQNVAPVIATGSPVKDRETGHDTRESMTRNHSHLYTTENGNKPTVSGQELRHETRESADRAQGTEVRQLLFEDIPNFQLERVSSRNISGKMSSKLMKKYDIPQKFDKKHGGNGGQCYSVILQSVIPASRQWGGVLSQPNYHPIRVDFKASCDINSSWTYGMALTVSSAMSMRTLCFLCGSAGKYDFIYCNICCEPFHTFCLEDSEQPTPGHLDDWCCAACQFCHVCGRQNNLLQCNKCRNTYHPGCLGPNYPTQPSKRHKIWICTKCVKCVSCGATTPGTSAQATWTYDFSLCYECGLLMDKGNFCPICRKCYSDDDWESKMIQCNNCESWVHSKCEGLTDEMYEILSFLPEDLSFYCRRCHPVGCPEWERTLKSELRSGLENILQALILSSSAQYILKPEQKSSPSKPVCPELTQDKCPQLTSDNTSKVPLEHTLSNSVQPYLDINIHVTSTADDSETTDRVVQQNQDIDIIQDKSLNFTDVYNKGVSNLIVNNAAICEFPNTGHGTKYLTSGSSKNTPESLPKQHQLQPFDRSDVKDNEMKFNCDIKYDCDTKCHTKSDLQLVKQETLCDIENGCEFTAAKHSDNFNNPVDSKGSQVYKSVDSIGQGVDNIAQGVDNIGQGVDNIGQGVDNISQDVDNIGQGVDNQLDIKGDNADIRVKNQLFNDGFSLSKSETHIESDLTIKDEKCNRKQRCENEDSKSSREIKPEEALNGDVGEALKSGVGDCGGQLSKTESCIQPAHRIHFTIDEDNNAKKQPASVEVQLHVPKDLMEIADKMKIGFYNSVAVFCEDILCVIQNYLDDDDEVRASRKRAVLSVRSIFVKQVEKIFPWFKVKSCRHWYSCKNIPHGMLPDATLPPYNDHTYAQWLERIECLRSPQPSPFKKRGATPVKRLMAPDDEEYLDAGQLFDGDDMRKCMFCHVFGDQAGNDAGQLLYCGQDDWCHINCALWSAEVYEERDGALKNLVEAFSRGKMLKCDLCGKTGATVGCNTKGCKSNYHFMCARKMDCWLQEDKKVFCKVHRLNIDGTLLEPDKFEVLRRVYVETANVRSVKKKWVNGLDSKDVSVLIGSCCVESLGRLTDLSDCPKFLQPVDFVSSRVYWSTRDARRRCLYTCRVVEIRPEALKSPTVTVKDGTIVHDRSHPDYRPFTELDLSGVNLGATEASSENKSVCVQDILVQHEGCAKTNSVDVIDLTETLEDEKIHKSNCNKTNEFELTKTDLVMEFIADAGLNESEPAQMVNENLTISQNVERKKSLSWPSPSFRTQPTEQQTPAGADLSFLSPKTLKMLNIKDPSKFVCPILENKLEQDEEFGLLKIANRLNIAAARSSKSKCKHSPDFSRSAGSSPLTINPLYVDRISVNCQSTPFSQNVKIRNQRTQSVDRALSAIKYRTSREKTQSISCKLLDLPPQPFTPPIRMLSKSKSLSIEKERDEMAYFTNMPSNEPFLPNFGNDSPFASRRYRSVSDPLMLPAPKPVSNHTDITLTKEPCSLLPFEQSQIKNKNYCGSTNTSTSENSGSHDLSIQYLSKGDGTEVAIQSGDEQSFELSNVNQTIDDGFQINDNDTEIQTEDKTQTIIVMMDSKDGLSEEEAIIFVEQVMNPSSSITVNSIFMEDSEASSNGIDNVEEVGISLGPVDDSFVLNESKESIVTKNQGEDYLNKETYTDEVNETMDAKCGGSFEIIEYVDDGSERELNDNSSGKEPDNDSKEEHDNNDSEKEQDSDDSEKESDNNDSEKEHDSNESDKEQDDEDEGNDNDNDKEHDDEDNEKDYDTDDSEKDHDNDGNEKDHDNDGSEKEHDNDNNKHKHDNGVYEKENDDVDNEHEYDKMEHENEYDNKITKEMQISVPGIISNEVESRNVKKENSEEPFIPENEVSQSNSFLFKHQRRRHSRYSQDSTGGIEENESVLKRVKPGFVETNAKNCSKSEDHNKIINLDTNEDNGDDDDIIEITESIFASHVSLSKHSCEKKASESVGPVKIQCDDLTNSNNSFDTDESANTNVSMLESTMKNQCNAESLISTNVKLIQSSTEKLVQPDPITEIFPHCGTPNSEIQKPEFAKDVDLLVSNDEIEGNDVMLIMKEMKFDLIDKGIKKEKLENCKFFSEEIKCESHQLTEKNEKDDEYEELEKYDSKQRCSSSESVCLSKVKCGSNVTCNIMCNPLNNLHVDTEVDEADMENVSFKIDSQMKTIANSHGSNSCRDQTDNNFCKEAERQKQEVLRGLGLGTCDEVEKLKNSPTKQTVTCKTEWTRKKSKVSRTPLKSYPLRKNTVSPARYRDAKAFPGKSVCANPNNDTPNSATNELPVLDPISKKIKEESLAKSVPGEKGPFKCPKCRRLYRTEESYTIHVEKCNFCVSSSEDSDNEEYDRKESSVKARKKRTMLHNVSHNSSSVSESEQGSGKFRSALRRSTMCQRRALEIEEKRIKGVTAVVGINMENNVLANDKKFRSSNSELECNDKHAANKTMGRGIILRNYKEKTVRNHVDWMIDQGRDFSPHLGKGSPPKMNVVELSNKSIESCSTTEENAHSGRSCASFKRKHVGDEDLCKDNVSSEKTAKRGKLSLRNGCHDRKSNESDSPIQNGSGHYTVMTVKSNETKNNSAENILSSCRHPFKFDNMIQGQSKELSFPVEKRGRGRPKKLNFEKIDGEILTKLKENFDNEGSGYSSLSPNESASDGSIDRNLALKWKRCRHETTQSENSIEESDLRIMKDSFTEHWERGCSRFDSLGKSTEAKYESSKIELDSAADKRKNNANCMSIGDISSISKEISCSQNSMKRKRGRPRKSKDSICKVLDESSEDDAEMSNTMSEMQCEGDDTKNNVNDDIPVLDDGSDDTPILDDTTGLIINKKTGTVLNISVTREPVKEDNKPIEKETIVHCAAVINDKVDQIVKCMSVHSNDEIECTRASKDNEEINKITIDVYATDKKCLKDLTNRDFDKGDKVTSETLKKTNVSLPMGIEETQTGAKEFSHESIVETEDKLANKNIDPGEIKEKPNHRGEEHTEEKIISVSKTIQSNSLVENYNIARVIKETSLSKDKMSEIKSNVNQQSCSEIKHTSNEPSVNETTFSKKSSLNDLPHTVLKLLKQGHKVVIKNPKLNKNFLWQKTENGYIGKPFDNNIPTADSVTLEKSVSVPNIDSSRQNETLKKNETCAQDRNDKLRTENKFEQTKQENNLLGQETNPMVCTSMKLGQETSPMVCTSMKLGQETSPMVCTSMKSLLEINPVLERNTNFIAQNIKELIAANIKSKTAPAIQNRQTGMKNVSVASAIPNRQTHTGNMSAASTIPNRQTGIGYMSVASAIRNQQACIANVPAASAIPNRQTYIGNMSAEYIGGLVISAPKSISITEATLTIQNSVSLADIALQNSLLLSQQPQNAIYHTSMYHTQPPMQSIIPQHNFPIIQQHASAHNIVQASFGNFSSTGLQTVAQASSIQCISSQQNLHSASQFICNQPNLQPASLCIGSLPNSQPTNQCMRTLQTLQPAVNQYISNQQTLQPVSHCVPGQQILGPVSVWPSFPQIPGIGTGITSVPIISAQNFVQGHSNIYNVQGDLGSYELRHPCSESSVLQPGVMMFNNTTSHLQPTNCLQQAMFVNSQPQFMNPPTQPAHNSQVVQTAVSVQSPSIGTQSSWNNSNLFKITPGLGGGNAKLFDKVKHMFNKQKQISSSKSTNADGSRSGYYSDENESVHMQRSLALKGPVPHNATSAASISNPVMKKSLHTAKTSQKWKKRKSSSLNKTTSKIPNIAKPHQTDKYSHPIIHPQKEASTLPVAAVEEEVRDVPMSALEDDRLGSGSSGQKLGHLEYEIASDDGFVCRADTIDGAWKQVTEKVQDARTAARLKNLAYAGLSGLKMFGLSHPTVMYLVEQLYGASYCRRYKFKYHKHEQEEHELELVNPSGCIRTEAYSGRNPWDMFSFLMSQYRQKPEHVITAGDEEMAQKSSRRATSMDLPMAMRFRKLKEHSKEAVGVYRSTIHGRGLFCKRSIDAGEMVIEYAGEMIRNALTDLREKYYESKGIGCYMFRIDDADVVDATMKGSAARFINHSCEPNCYSKVITVDNRKHIVIFAMRKILRGEELTYDYKFPIEEVKILCTCGSKRCRKYLN